jgi:hypothetical protein
MDKTANKGPLRLMMKKGNYEIWTRWVGDEDWESVLIIDGKEVYTSESQLDVHRYCNDVYGVHI